MPPRIIMAPATAYPGRKPGPARPVADEDPIEGRTDGAAYLGDHEEDSQRLRPDLVRRAGARSIGCNNPGASTAWRMPIGGDYPF